MLFSLLFQQPHYFFIIILSILYTLTVHEYAHAQMAYLLGDRTAEHYGRLTLNPLAHLDLWGFLMLLFVGFGWGKPVPFNPLNFKDREKGTALVGVAGPGANLVSFFVFGFIYRLTSSWLGPDNLLTIFLVFLIMYNGILALFNLIPIPPLDGSKILFMLLPARFNRFKYSLRKYGPTILMALIFVSIFLGVPVFTGLFSGIIILAQKFFGVFPALL